MAVVDKTVFWPQIRDKMLSVLTSPMSTFLFCVALVHIKRLRSNVIFFRENSPSPCFHFHNTNNHKILC